MLIVQAYPCFDNAGDVIAMSRLYVVSVYTKLRLWQVRLRTVRFNYSRFVVKIWATVSRMVHPGRMDPQEVQARMARQALTTCLISPRQAPMARGLKDLGIIDQGPMDRHTIRIDSDSSVNILPIFMAFYTQQRALIFSILLE